jgi:hypothetical protein
LTKIDGCGDEDENKRRKQRKKKLLDNGSSLDSGHSRSNRWEW